MKKKVLIVLTMITMITISITSFICGTKTNTNDNINMNTIVDFETTEYGLMLYTNDGSGYYWER